MKDFSDLKKGVFMDYLDSESQELRDRNDGNVTSSWQRPRALQPISTNIDKKVSDSEKKKSSGDRIKDAYNKKNKIKSFRSPEVKKEDIAVMKIISPTNRDFLKIKSPHSLARNSSSPYVDTRFNTSRGENSRNNSSTSKKATHASDQDPY